jgi:hypothetical protein
MSQEGVRTRIVQELGRVMAAEDAVVRMNDPALLEEGVEAMRKVAAPDFVFALVTPEQAGGASTEYVGIERFVDGWHDWLGVFDSFRIEPRREIETADTVVSITRITATPKRTTATIHEDAAALFTFDADKVRRMEFHLDQSTAFRAAGLSE